MSSLFGVELPTPVNFVIAFVFVLLLIGAAAWLVRRFGAAQIDAAARGRQPRLAVVDSAAVDGRRKLVIIRRDNVEHLLMIGGPSDVVVETNHPRHGRRDPRGTGCTQRRRNPAAHHAAGRSDTLAAATGTGAAAVRNARAAADEIWNTPTQPAAASRAARSRRFARCAPPTRLRASPTRSPVPPPKSPSPAAARRRTRQGGQGAQVQQSRPTPPTPPAAATVAPPNPAADQSLAEMAQRLEAALRRPMAQKVVTETQRVTATVDVKAVTPKGPAPAKTQSGNLEQEMASLLSKPGKT